MRLLAAAATACALTGCLDAPPEDGDGSPGPCGTLRALVDDFESDLLALRWEPASGLIEANGGRVRLSSEPGMPDAVLKSSAFYQVQGAQLTVEIDLGDLADGTFAVAMVAPDGSLVAMVAGAGNQIELRVVDAGGDRAVDAAAFDPAARWWRLREEAGGFYWSQSAAAPGEEERGPIVADVGPVVQAELTVEAVELPAAVVIASVNDDGAAEPLCPAATLTDDFATLSPRWQVDEQGDCAITADGRAELGYSTQAFCALTTRERFALAGSAFSVELAEIADCKPEPTMQVSLPGGEVLELACHDDGGELQLVARSADAGPLGMVPYDPAGHRFVRVRHERAAATVRFETSAGDGMWEPFAARALSDGEVAEAMLRFYLGGETSGGFESIALDSVGLAP
jgi:hypothetical protein